MQNGDFFRLPKFPPNSQLIFSVHFLLFLRAPPPVRVTQSIPIPIKYCCWFSPSIYSLAGTYHHVLTLPDSTPRIQASDQLLSAKLSSGSLFHHISFSGHTTPPLLTASWILWRVLCSTQCCPSGELSTQVTCCTKGQASELEERSVRATGQSPGCTSTSLWMQ